MESTAERAPSSAPLLQRGWGDHGADEAIEHNLGIELPVSNEVGSHERRSFTVSFPALDGAFERNDRLSCWIAAWLLVCSRYRRNDNVATVLELSANDEIYQLPFRFQIDPTATARELVDELRANLEEVQSCAFDELANLRGSEPMELPRLVLHHEPFEVTGLGIAAIESDHETQLKAVFNPALYESESIETLLHSVTTVGNDMVNRPDAAVSTINMLTDEDRYRLERWNATDVDRTASSIVELVQQQAAANPDQLAVVACDGDITYRQLLSRSECIANYLLERRLTPAEPVALMTDRRCDMLPAILGIIRAGGVYLPIDASHPDSRIKHMLDEANARFAVVSSSHQARIDSLATSPSQMESIDLDAALRCSIRRELPKLTGEMPVYIMFTSGSTGLPKGVQVLHRNLVNQCAWFIDYYKTSTRDRTLQFSSVGFDISAEEIFPSMCTGATIVLRDDSAVYDPLSFNRFVKEHGITLLSPPTAFWHEWVVGLKAAQQKLPSCLRAVVIGGEKAAADVWKSWQEVGGDAVELVNSYGPTETTVSCSYFSSDQGYDDGKPVPIGIPQANTKIHILDHHGQPLPVGVLGELYIAGDNVTSGYVNQPEKTAAKFVNNPFSTDPNATMYRSGDLAYWRADGQLMIAGRIDNQVKIGGFRVEVDEIASRLNELANVEQAFVTTVVRTEGTKELAAYCVATEDDFDVVAIRKALRSTLPVQWIPKYLVRVDGLPLTLNGKVDTKMLPDIMELPNQNEFSTELTVTEQKVAEAFCEVLGPADYDRCSNFFELGGDSLQAVALVSHLDRTLGRSFPLAQMVSNASIQHIATLVGDSDDETQSKQWSPFRPLKVGGHRPPLFFVPEITGDAFRLRKLAEYLDDDQQFIALQTPGYEDDQEPFYDISEMASYFVDEMCAHHDGPYFLGGFCFGAAVAFEMARQLQMRNEQVAFLAIVECELEDSPYIYGGFKSPRKALKMILNAPRWIWDMSVFLGPTWIFKEVWRQLAKGIRHKIGPARLATDEEIALEAIPQELRGIPEKHREVWIAHECAAATYRSQPFDGHGHFFQSKTRPARYSLEPIRHWRELCLGGVSHVKVRGFHQRILHEPNVQELARALSQELRNAQDKKG